MSGLHARHRRMGKAIAARLRRFESVGKKGGRRLFEELSFCLLTPQSKAFSCDSAIRQLRERKLLLGGGVPPIRAVLAKKTRFHNRKAEYLVLAREKFRAGGFARLAALTFGGSEQQARDALLREVKGMGLKEASHYLRNVGRGRTLAILDRHILRNLAKHGVIRGIPKSLTPKKYLEIEKRMGEFCRGCGIPMAHLDLLFWAEETGRIFK